jgi:hypothetical protein
VSGTSKYLPVTGTSLQWLSNTESDVFVTDRQDSLLPRCRFSSVSRRPVIATLDSAGFQKDTGRPSAFARGVGSGTDEAAEAVLMAAIPQTARVHRYDTKAK